MIVSVFFDKFLGLFSMTLLGLPLLLLSPSAMDQRWELALLLGLPCLAGLLILVSLWRGWLGQFIRALGLKFLQALEEVAYYYHHAGRLLLKTTFLSFLFHLIYALAFYLLSRSLNLDLHFFDAAWIFAALSLVMFLPFSLMGFGLREGGLVVLGGLIGLAQPSCLALALLLFLATLALSLLGWLIDLTYLSTDHKRVV